jgi:hypothetical protein
MPAVKIKPKRSQQKSTQETESSLVVIIVDGEQVEVYTGKEAEEKLAE